ncbi:hypothetical protein [Acidianus ambivalens]|uniref:Uncharacterized protein n=1 Tax=Acidianus ambivalens TaxID=2283 RepID=A0A650CYA4_ACIAM|nr:hypothetical protein [Acidianus ambivalens]MQL55007.1 hypothetical protein [Acidianus ambivalens]QGR22788.1 hypothetical protein D1866_12965 [Acidianus ambivalens]
MKGLSAVIGMVFLLIVMIAVLIPLALTVTSTTSKEEENINAIQPLQVEVEEQISEVNTENSPIGFYYCNVTGKAILVYYSSPPIPLNVSYFLGYKGGYIQIIDPQPTKTTWNKYPALEYQVGNFNKLAMVTTLGNIIYADPMPHLQQSSNSSSAYDPYWVYRLNTPYTSYTNPSNVQICSNPSAITNDWKPCGINNAVLIVLKQSHKPLCINLTIHFSCYFATNYRHSGDVGTNIGIYSGSFYGQIEFGNYFLGANSGVWPYEGFQCILLNVSHGYVSTLAFCYVGLGVLASCSYLVYKTRCAWGSVSSFNYLLSIHINCCCQIYIELYKECNGKYVPVKLPCITPKYAKFYPCEPLTKFEGNYNETEWGHTVCYMCVPKSTSCVVPFGEIKAAVKVVGYAACGFCPVEYPYDPIGVAVEIMWGESIYVSGIQIAD